MSSVNVQEDDLGNVERRNIVMWKMISGNVERRNIIIHECLLSQ